MFRSGCGADGGPHSSMENGAAQRGLSTELGLQEMLARAMAKCTPRKAAYRLRTSSLKTPNACKRCRGP